MGTAKGIIMEQNGDEIILLTAQGEFKKINVPGYKADIGDEISIAIPDYKKNMFFRNKWWLAAAAVFLIMFIPFLMNQGVSSTQAVAYLSVDINPSIEFALDKNNQIIDSKGWNSDGDQIIRQTKLKGLKAPDAVMAITDQAYKDGFISNEKDNAIVISVTAKDKSYNLAGLENNLKSAAQSVLTKENLGGVVQTVITSSNIRQEAMDMGLSTGKYAIYLEAVNSGLKITPNDIKNASIAQVIKNAGGQVGEIVGKAHEEKDLEQIAKANREKELNEAGNNLSSAENKKPAAKDKSKGNQKTKKESPNNDDNDKIKSPTITNPQPPTAPDRPTMEIKEEKDVND